MEHINGFVMFLQRMLSRKIQKADSIQILGKTKFLLSGRGIPVKSLPRKTSKIIIKKTVPQTDTGRLVENTKVNGLVLPKELGKKAAVT